MQIDRGMKIAVVGKGGSGKSVVSWLLSKHLAKNNHVLDIDEDFNMDLTQYLLGDKQVKDYIFNNHQQFRKLFGMNQNEKWFDLVKKQQESTFSFSQLISLSFTQTISPSLHLWVTGLGDEDALLTGKCGHSHSAPLKYLLPSISLEKNEFIIIDSVAGVDMLMYGLFMGCDIVLVCIDPTPNSFKVGKQIISLCNKLGLDYRIILTKSQQNQISELVYEEFKDFIIGSVRFESTIMEGDYDKLTDGILKDINVIEKNLTAIPYLDEDRYLKLQTFEMQKESIQKYFNT